MSSGQPALNIIREASNFIEFAVALTDYMDKDFIPYCKSVYMMLVNAPGFSDTVFNYRDIDKITPTIIESEYNNFILQQQEKQRESEFKENIDEFQFLIRSYRKSVEFQYFLNFVGCFCVFQSIATQGFQS